MTKSDAIDLKEVWMSLTYTSGESDGTPLQYSCPENPMDGGAWWAAVHRVAEGQTRLSDLGSIPVSGTSPGEDKGYPLQYSGLENFMD